MFGKDFCVNDGVDPRDTKAICIEGIVDICHDKGYTSDNPYEFKNTPVIGNIQLSKIWTEFLSEDEAYEEEYDDGEFYGKLAYVWLEVIRETPNGSIWYDRISNYDNHEIEQIWFALLKDKKNWAEKK